MPLARDVSRGGISGGTALAMNGTIATGLTAAGTTITTALSLSATTNSISTCAAGAGVQLPSMQLGDDCWVYNGVQANSLLVYPDLTTVAINQLAVGAGVPLPPQTGALFKKVTSTQTLCVMSR